MRMFENINELNAVYSINISEDNYKKFTKNPFGFDKDEISLDQLNFINGVICNSKCSIGINFDGVYDYEMDVCNLTETIEVFYSLESIKDILVYFSIMAYLFPKDKKV